GWSICPGRSAAAPPFCGAGALQTRDRNRYRPWKGPGSATQHFVLHRVRDKYSSIARDDLALVAMHDRRRRHHARAAAQEDRRPAILECRTAAPAWDGGCTLNGAKPFERLAQPALGICDQERHAKHASPRLPFGNDIGAVRRAIKLERERRIAVFED